MNPPASCATVVVMPMGRTHEDIQDELLVLQCQDGDDAALKTLVSRWQPRLARFAWRLTSERDAARDIVQDSWLAIVRGIRRLDDPARFRSWAYRIVSNKCADWIRRRSAQRKAAKELQGDTVTDYEPRTVDGDSADDVDRLRVALRQLPSQQRAILSLHYLDGIGVAEIARVLDVAVGTVKSRLHHARNGLRKSLERKRS